MFSICVDLCNKWETGKWPSCKRNKRGLDWSFEIMNDKKHWEAGNGNQRHIQHHQAQPEGFCLVNPKALSKPSWKIRTNTSDLSWRDQSVTLDQTMVGSDVTTPVLGPRYPNKMCLKSSIYPLDSSIYCSALIWIVWTKAIRHPCETGEWKIKFEISHFTHWSAQNSPSEKEILLWQYLTKGHNVHLCK